MTREYAGGGSPELPDAPWASNELPDAPWATKPSEPAKPNIGVVEDVVKSGGTGLVKGAAGLAGVPGDVGSLMTSANHWLADKTAGTALDGLVKRREDVTAFPGSADIQRTIEKVTGPLHKPQTTAGKYVETAAEFIPGAVALGPAGVARGVIGKVGNAGRNAVRYGVVPGVASETAGQLTEGTAAEPWARAGTALVAGGAMALTDRGAPVVRQVPVGTNAAPEFKIPLSAGQANRDVDASMLEQGALRGGYGPRAAQVAKDFFDQQQAATEGARAQIGTKLDRFGQDIAPDAMASAELASESIKRAASQAKATTGKLYDEVAELPGEIHAGAFEGIGQKIKGELSLGDRPVIIDDVTTPIATRALRDIEENISRLKVQNRADPFGQPSQEDIIGINLKGVDQTRKRLISFAGAAKANPTDARATSAIIRAFDKQVEQAIDNGLFSGDPRALDALKAARKSHENYRKTFTSQKGDGGVGLAMEKIVGRNGGEGADAGTVANYLYGTANLGAKDLSIRLTRHLKGVLGEDSPEWSGVRQGLWNRLTTATEGRTDWGPQKMSERIYEFVNGSGRPISDILFTQAERQNMRRFADALKELVPPPGAVNYSNSAAHASKMAGHALEKVVGFLGHGVMGMGANMALKVGRNFIQSGTNQRKVMRSLYPDLPQRGPIRSGATRPLAGITARPPSNSEQPSSP